MVLRGGPTRLREGVVIGDGGAVEVGQRLARVVVTGDQDRAVIAGGTAVHAVVGGADKGDKVMEFGTEGKAAGLRQEEVRVDPVRHEFRVATAQGFGCRDAAGGEGLPDQLPVTVCHRTDFRAVIHRKGGDHARSALCRARLDSTSVRATDHIACINAARSSGAVAALSARVKRTVSGASLSSVSASVRRRAASNGPMWWRAIRMRSMCS